MQVQQQYQDALQKHERRVAERQKALYAAGSRLTEEIRRIWNDDTLSLRLEVDGQYLQTLVEDGSGVQVELDQRSEGFRWLVSFFVVFHAQAADSLKEAVLLLDEPVVLTLLRGSESIWESSFAVKPRNLSNWRLPKS